MNTLGEIFEDLVGGLGPRVGLGVFVPRGDPVTPTLISLYPQGRLPLEKFDSERIGLHGIEDAFHNMHAGEVLRSVVVLK